MANEVVGLDLSNLTQEVLRDFLAQYVKAISIESSYTDPLIIPKPFAPSEAPPSGVGEEVRPKMIFLFEDGKTVTLAPWGEPDPSKRNRLYYAAGGIAVLSAGALVLLLKKGK